MNYKSPLFYLFLVAWGANLLLGDPWDAVPMFAIGAIMMLVAILLMLAVLPEGELWGYAPSMALFGVTFMIIGAGSALEPPTSRYVFASGIPFLVAAGVTHYRRHQAAGRTQPP